MRRRPGRPGRRGRGRRPPLAGRRAAVPPRVRRALQRARRSLDTGRYEDAAAIYERLADRAYERDRMRAGVQMDLEATRAWLRANDLTAAQGPALHALDALLDRGQLPRVVMPIVACIASAMEAQGRSEDAAEFRAQVDARLEAHQADLDTIGNGSDRSERRRGRLPDQCPSCYAPLRSDEVQWLELDRVQCPYCGNVVLTE